MERRDLIKDQIENLGKVLAKIMSEFLRLKAQGRVSQGIEISNHSFKDKLDIDIETIIQLPKEEIKEYLKGRILVVEHIEVLSEYFREVGIKENEQGKKNGIWLSKAIELLDISDEITKTVSFDRINRKSEIEKLLK